MIGDDVTRTDHDPGPGHGQGGKQDNPGHRRQRIAVAHFQLQNRKMVRI